MNGDLISRSAMLRHFSDWQMECSAVGSEREYNLLDMAIKGIKNEPSAFDVQKIIQQLEENKENAIKAIEENSPSEFHMIKIKDLKELFEEYTREQIEIVQKGGV